MAVSFGIAKKIIEHRSYNLSLALPFVAAFYLLNDNAPVSVPLVDYAFGEQMSMVLKVLAVAFYYWFFLLFLVLSAGVSKLTTSSKPYYVYPALIVVASVFGFLNQDQGSANFGLVFGPLALVFLALSPFDKGYLSWLLVSALTAICSLLCFVSGILWFEDHYVFQTAIAHLFGFSALSPESLKAGWPMLVTFGYVLYYAVFETGEAWG